MANPRKFSEKIALHNQKQAEETAEFEKIMKEVSAATNKGNTPKKQHLRIINQSLGAFRAGSLPNVNNISNSATIELKSARSNMEELKSGQGSGMVEYRERARSTVGPMRSSRPGEKRIDTSPYSSAYSLQPPDSGWRRTHSDSALHTSSHEPSSQRRDGHNQLVDGYDTSRIVCPDGGRPRSSSDVPRVPGINIFPSQQDPGAVQIPIGNNTGSLPDLTSFHFPSPLNTPLDQDDHGSPYTNSSQCGSPSSLSPRSSGRFNFGGTPPHEAPGPPPQYANTNQLSVPPNVNSRLLHHCKGITHQSYQQQYVYQQPVSPSQQPVSPQSLPPQQSSLNSYRTPVKRPSPQTSPALTVKYPSPSPRSSSPQSPSSPCSIGGGMNHFTEHSSYFINQAQLQQHFEQFSMTEDGCTQLGSQELGTDPGYFSTSPSQQLQYTRGPHPTSTQTTPNTPSSIPDIVLTDFSNSDELAKDLGVAMGGPLESDLFPTDECLRAGLDPIDLDGLQLLTESELITDPATEDHFRLDRQC